MTELFRVLAAIGLVTAPGAAAALQSDAVRTRAATPAGETGPACPDPRQRRVQRGLMGAQLCVRPFADAGKACTRKAQCQGRCVATRMAKGVPPAIGAPATGRCEAETPSFGCMAEVENGKLKTPMLCTS